MHGVQKHAPGLREDYARGAEMCLRFEGDLCMGCRNVSQIWGEKIRLVFSTTPTPPYHNEGISLTFFGAKKEAKKHPPPLNLPLYWET
jgi:hypothetical protein